MKGRTRVCRLAASGLFASARWGYPLDVAHDCIRLLEVKTGCVVDPFTQRALSVGSLKPRRVSSQQRPTELPYPPGFPGVLR